MNNDECTGLDEYGMTFKQFLQLLKKSLPALIISVVAVTIASIVCFGVLSNNSRSYNATLTYNYAGGLQNKAPDGTILDLGEIKSNEILNKAISTCGLSVDVEMLKANINITAEKPNANSDFVYSVAFENFSKMKLSEAQASNLLNQIVKEYTSVFNDKYFPATPDVQNFSENLLVENDYIVACNKINNSLMQIFDVLENCSIIKDFVSPTYKYSFNVLLDELNLLKKTDFASLNKYILNYKFSKNVALLISDLEYSKINLTDEITIVQQKADTLLTTLGKFNSSGAGAGYFAEMFAEYDAVFTKLLNLKTQKSLIENEIAVMKVAPPASQPSDEEKLTEVTRLFNATRAKSMDIIQKLNVMQGEYNAKQRGETSVSISDAVYIQNGLSTKLSLALIALIIVLTACIAIWATNLSQKKLEKKKAMESCLENSDIIEVTDSEDKIDVKKE